MTELEDLNRSSVTQRSYRAPRLVEYGSLEERTRGSILAFDDDFSTGTTSVVTAPEPPPVDRERR